MERPQASVTTGGSTERNGRRILGYKRELSIGTWNLSSGINNEEGLEWARSALTIYNLDILCIPEAVRCGFGEERLSNGELLIWAGPKVGGQRQNAGVALLCSSRAAACLITRKQVSDRILTASFSMCHRITLDVVAFYAPHTSRDVAERKTFRNQLNDLRTKLNRHHFVVELGDANALVGSAAKGGPNFGGALGIHGVGTQNDAGRELLDDCAAAGLCIANTFFQHKDIHSYSHRMNDMTMEEGETREDGHRVYRYINNDFIIVRRSFLSSVRDVRVYREVNGGNDFLLSDHHLVVGRIKLHLRPRPPGRRNYR